MVNIVIIGTGGAGISFLRGLELSIPKGGSFTQALNIRILEKEDKIEGGMPYSNIKNYDSSIINMRLDEMSIPGGSMSSREFISQKLGITSDYPKRSDFGKYLQAEFDSVISDLRKKGVNVEIGAGEEALSVTKHGGQYITATNKGRSYKSDICVIATGHWPNQSMAQAETPYFSFSGDKEFLSKNLSAGHVKKICVIGSSLSAVDVIREIHSIKGNDPSVQIDMVSRNGVLPRVRSNQDPKKLSNNLLALALEKRKLSLQEVIDVLIEEISEERVKRGLSAISREDIDSFIGKWKNNPFKVLEQDLRDVNDDREDNQLSAHQIVYVPNSDTFVRAFNQFSQQDKLEYRRVYQTIHLSHLAPMPSESAALIDSLHKNGQLNIIRVDGNVSIDMSGNKPLLRYPGKTEEYDIVIDATGQTFDVSTNQTPLFESLRQSGLITRSSDGSCTRGSRFQSVGKAGECKNLYLLGVGAVTYGSERFSRVVKEGIICGKSVWEQSLKKHYRPNKGQQRFCHRL